MNLYTDYKPDEWNFSYSFGKIGRWAPNPLGIYDLAGNAWEWVDDWYSPDYYKESPELNPHGPMSGTEKVIRGFGDDAALNIVRGYEPTTHKKYKIFMGFRCNVESKEALVIH